MTYFNKQIRGVTNKTNRSKQRSEQKYTLQYKVFNGNTHVQKQKSIQAYKSEF